MNTTMHFHRNSLIPAALLLAAALQGCAGVNRIQSVELAPAQVPALGTPVTVVVKGVGRFSLLTVDWGDGTTSTISPANCAVRTDADGRKDYTCDRDHTYTGWSGGKTVVVSAASTAPADNIGRVQTRFKIPPAALVLAFARPGPNVCDPVPGMPPLAKRTLVIIRNTPINFACGGITFPNGGCYAPDG